SRARNSGAKHVRSARSGPLASPNAPSDGRRAVAGRPDHPLPRQLEPAYPGRIPRPDGSLDGSLDRDGSLSRPDGALFRLFATLFAGLHPSSKRCKNVYEVAGPSVAAEPVILHLAVYPVT